MQARTLNQAKGKASQIALTANERSGVWPTVLRMSYMTSGMAPKDSSETRKAAWGGARPRRMPAAISSGYPGGLLVCGAGITPRL
jgi:hypothetical protein